MVRIGTKNGTFYSSESWTPRQLALQIADLCLAGKLDYFSGFISYTDVHGNVKNELCGWYAELIGSLWSVVLTYQDGTRKQYISNDTFFTEVKK